MAMTRFEWMSARTVAEGGGRGVDDRRRGDAGDARRRARARPTC